ncbi:peptidylprolyl isomerase [Neolewinella antarctica]|uniref:Periplasmic chaperone PpiD n=1 Tax=Neolewinella antarctica TaxID=442734 RepID=A0ABX0XAK4_9BACT|nr:peptidylprolyl isomerase [Neolewinella antarctica]NJC25978.1 peptidyl-prolyl cis-trans isomerase D [Neolewinella antarctica]
MALIGKIRNNPLIVLLFIGGGIALFILSEMTNGGAAGPIGPAEQIMGRVGQREIDRNEFERTLSGAFNGGDAFQNRDNLWQFYVDEGVITEEAEEIGLTVSEEELEELEFGSNPSPIIRRNLTDPQTGQLNRTLLDQIKGHIDANTVDQAIQNGELNPDIRTIWRYQRRNIVTNRLQEKMNALVSKAMYAPSWQAQTFADAQLGNRRVAVAQIPFTDLGADDQEVTDADIQTYVDENRSIFNNPEETRVLEYIVFDVEATPADMAKLNENLTTAAAEWRQETTADGDSLFAVANGGTYTGNYEPRERLDGEVADRVLDDMEIGTIYGPYRQDNTMRLVKLRDRVTMADSAKTRHILLSAQTPGQFDAADARADSLINVLNGNRRKFGAMVTEFSEDPGSKDNEGVYEKVTPGQFVRPFDAVLFRTGDVGKLYKVRTSYGVHVVEVMSRSASTSPRAMVATIVEPITPSSDTEDTRLQEAQQFVNGKTSVKALADAGMKVTTTNPVRLATYNLPELGSGQEIKDLMCWAFSADAGDLSGRVYRFTDEVLFYENKYVVAGLKEVVPAGVAPVATVRDAVSPQVRNRVVGARVRGELSGQSLSNVAAQYGVTIDTVSSNPSLSSLPRIGNEPKVIAAAARATIGQPITVVGNTGVYVVEAITDAATGTSGSLPGARTQLNSRTRSQASAGIMPALRLAADVEDERASQDCR